MRIKLNQPSAITGEKPGGFPILPCPFIFERGLFVALTFCLLISSCGGGGGSGGGGDPPDNPPDDTIPPTVSSTYPVDHDMDIDVASPIIARFSEEVAYQSITNSTFFIVTWDGQPVNGNITYADKRATFHPATDLARDTTYSVTITAGVRDLAGNSLQADHVWYFTTKGRSWSMLPQLIEDGPWHAWDPQIAVDGMGNVFAIWEQSDGIRSNIMYNRYDAFSGQWNATAQVVGSDNAEHAFDPQIAADADGNAIAVWRQFNGAVFSIYANRFDVTTYEWGSPQLLSSGTGSADAPQIAMDSAGNAIAVWSQWDGASGGNRVHVNRYTPSDDWLGIQTIDANMAPATIPEIAMDGNGMAAAVWKEGNNIAANRYDPLTGLWNEAQLIETGSGDVDLPQIAFDGNGNAMAIWVQYDETVFPNRNRVFSNRYDAVAEWLGAEPVESNAGKASTPQIAMDANGKAIAVWQQWEANLFRIYANRYLPGIGWGATTALTGLLEEVSSPQIAVGTAGNAVAVWSQLTSSGYGIHYTRYLAATDYWDPITQPISNSAGGTFTPQIAMDSSGNAVAVWRQMDSGVNNIRVNRYQ